MRCRRGFVTAACLCAALAATGCGARRAPLSELPVREFAGHYVGGPGASWFRPCGAPRADRSWWVTLTERAVGQADQARSEGKLLPGKSYFVRWRAALMTDGSTGPQGPGVPALLVRDLIELREAAEHDCDGGAESP